MTSNIALLQQFYGEEETDNIIYSVREELMDQVMTGCYKSYLKKQTVRFIVQCAYDAIEKFIFINFYHHCEPPDVTLSMWEPDEPIGPSPKDSWAHSAVPVKSRDIQDDAIDQVEERSITSERKIDIKDLESGFSVGCSCNHNCDCMLSQGAPFQEIPLLYQKPPSKVKFGPKPSVMKIEEKVNGKETLKSIVDASVLSSNNSTTATEFQTEGTTTTFTSKDESKKKKDKVFIKELKKEVPSAVERGSQASVVKLPPIRVNTKLTSKLEQIKKKVRN